MATWSSPPSSPPSDLPQVVALKAFKKYYDDGRFTDLTITCNGEEYKCHKVIVCAQSSFFEAACTNGFQESLTSTIDLPDDDPYYIFLMLEFLYLQTYMKTKNAADKSVDDMNDPQYTPRVHIHLHELGDKYGISKLSRHAAECLRHKAYHSSLVHLLNCVHLVYENDSDVIRTLRAKIVKALVDRSAEIAEDEEQKGRLLELVHDKGQFGEDLCLAQLHRKVLGVPGKSWDA